MLVYSPVIHSLVILTSRADITLLPERDETGTKGFYKPIVFPNDFWQLRSQYIEINTTTPILPLTVILHPMTHLKFQIFSTMTASFNEASKQPGVSSSEFDEIKRMLVETNPYFLGLTAFVSILHVLYVAFALFTCWFVLTFYQVRIPSIQHRRRPLAQEEGNGRCVGQVSQLCHPSTSLADLWICSNRTVRSFMYGDIVAC